MASLQAERGKLFGTVYTTIQMIETIKASGELHGLTRHGVVVRMADRSVRMVRPILLRCALDLHRAGVAPGSTLQVLLARRVAVVAVDMTLVLAYCVLLCRYDLVLRASSARSGMLNGHDEPAPRRHHQGEAGRGRGPRAGRACWELHRPAETASTGSGALTHYLELGQPQADEVRAPLRALDWAS